jgi:hypothetical protein
MERVKGRNMFTKYQGKKLIIIPKLRACIILKRILNLARINLDKDPRDWILEGGICKYNN